MERKIVPDFRRHGCLWLILSPSPEQYSTRVLSSPNSLAPTFYRLSSQRKEKLMPSKWCLIYWTSSVQEMPSPGWNWVGMLLSSWYMSTSTYCGRTGIKDPTLSFATNLSHLFIFYYSRKSSQSCLMWPKKLYRKLVTSTWMSAKPTLGFLAPQEHHIFYLYMSPTD